MKYATCWLKCKLKCVNLSNKPVISLPQTLSLNFLKNECESNTLEIEKLFVANLLSETDYSQMQEMFTGQSEAMV